MTIQLKMIKISTVSGTQEVIKSGFSNSIYLKMVKQDKITFLKNSAYLQDKNNFELNLA